MSPTPPLPLHPDAPQGRTTKALARTWSLLLLLMLTACGVPENPHAEQADPGAVGGDTVPAAPRDGPQVQQLPDGTTLRGVVRNGRRHGIWRSFTTRGRLLSQTEYRDGMAHGPVAVFHPNGAVRYLGQNHHGTPVGEWRFHDEAGALIKTVVYDSTGTVRAEH